MNLASLAPALGALVWIFQQGNLATPLQFTPTGGLSLVIIVLTAVFAFGLSTDYEVFLLVLGPGRPPRGRDTDTAVATGIQRTGRIITVAALLIVVVFTGFAPATCSVVKQLGLGLAIAVLLDATIVRLALTPALMTTFGRHNWAGPALGPAYTSRRLWHHDTRLTAPRAGGSVRPYPPVEIRLDDDVPRVRHPWRMRASAALIALLISTHGRPRPAPRPLLVRRRVLTASARALADCDWLSCGRRYS